MRAHAFTRAVLRAAVFTAIMSGVLALAVPLGVQAQQDAPAKTAGKSMKGKSPEAVETHINDLREKLMITAAQEPAWNALAQVMRDNAAKMNAAYQQFSQHAADMNALDNLREHGNLAEQHAQAYKVLIPAFETLYNSLSPEQKKTADMLFSHQGKRSRAKKGN
jgi:hypothetical protein